jgi:hypothetical protein
MGDAKREPFKKEKNRKEDKTKSNPKINKNY